jgi:hypothetical protein
VQGTSRAILNADQFNVRQNVMHRIPHDLDLSVMRGLEVTQIATGQHQVIVRFSPEGSITLEGSWVLKDNVGKIIDRSMEHSDRASWSLHKLLGKKVEGWKVKHSQHLDVFFGDLTLEIEDSSDRYESFSIVHSGLKLYV